MPRPERLIFRGAIVAAALLVIACSSAPPGTREPVEAELLPANDRPSAHYGGEARPLELTDREREILEAAEATSCEQDPRLIYAARRHARDLAASAAPDPETGIDHIRFALLSAGCGDHTIQPMSARLTPEGIEALAGFAGENSAEWTHCGIGVGSSGGEEWAVLIGVDRLVSLNAVPVISPAGSTLDVIGRSRANGSSTVQAFLGTPDGGVVRPDTTVSVTGDFVTRIALDRPGRYDLEIQVDKGNGPETAILLPLYADAEPDPLPVVTPGASFEKESTDPGPALLRLINSVRRRSGARPLMGDPRLDAIAAAHSADMVALDYFGHKSPRTGMLPQRLEAAGLAPPISAENVARSSSLLRAHRNLVASPSHRIKMVDPSFTHAGVGIARDGDDVVVTEIFARW